MNKYTIGLADRLCASQKRQSAYRGLCVSVQAHRPPMEEGLYVTAGLATAVLTIVLFAIWFVAG